MSLIFLLISVYLWRYHVRYYAWNMPEVYNPALLSILASFMAGIMFISEIEILFKG